MTFTAERCWNPPRGKVPTEILLANEMFVILMVPSRANFRLVTTYKRSPDAVGRTGLPGHQISFGVRLKHFTLTGSRAAA